ncbi:hypothetical protein KR49_00030 [Synechococcus sp. KORDI-49]|nr:hypothetical protein KR49_00030 [Synechococcus sp. KORDI-49]
MISVTTLIKLLHWLLMILMSYLQTNHQHLIWPLILIQEHQMTTT